MSCLRPNDMRASQRENVVPAMFSEDTNLIELGSLDQDREVEQCRRAVVKNHADAVGAWKILSTETLARIVREGSQPMSNLCLPPRWEVVMLHLERRSLLNVWLHWLRADTFRSLSRLNRGVQCKP
jgi:hypothetical protein